PALLRRARGGDGGRRARRAGPAAGRRAGEGVRAATEDPRRAAPLMSPRTLRAALAAVLLPASLAGRAAAQDRIFVRPEAGTPVVAVQVLVGVGPADEPAAQAGISYLAARAVVEPTRATLDSLGAH